MRPSFMTRGRITVRLGELRRVELTELAGASAGGVAAGLTSNPNFMGVYRWNILRGSL
jgi:uncharacterized protein YfaT (DUF1175 family)